MTAVSSYSLLSAKYGNFIVPALKIKVDGEDLVKNQGLMIEELQVRLSLTAAGSAVFKIAGIYEEKSHSFQGNVKTKLKPGTVVEVETGYLSSTQKVFKGYVAMLGAEFGEVPRLVVTLMDARRLMMTSGKKSVLHNVKNYSDAVKKVLGDYSKLCSSSVDATDDALTRPVSQTTNDYDFITRELIHRGRADREFFIIGDKVYFRTPKKISLPMMTVRYGRELQSLNVNFAYLDLKVEVTGYNAKEQEAVRASGKAKGCLGQKKLFGVTPVSTFLDPDADSQGKARVRAEAAVRSREDQRCTGRGSVIGLPEVIPGRFLKVEGLDSLVNQQYYITEVTHVMNKESYITHFEIGGVKG